MSRTALVGAFAFVVAGLAGCASPAHLVNVDRDAGRVVVAVPEDTNTWPYYYRDEATLAAAQNIPEPQLKKVTRVKVGEQMTNKSDTSRREIGSDRRPGEVTTSSNTTSVSDKYEYQMVFESAVRKLPNFVKQPGVAATPAPAPAPIPGAAPAVPNPIVPVGGSAPAVTSPMPMPANDILAPSAVPPASTVPAVPSTNLPPVYIPEPGRR